MFKRMFGTRRATLADCSACGADFVHPVEWRSHDAHSWWILLRCGECGNCWEQTVSDGEAELFDRELQRAEHGMRCEADRMSREALEQQADTFAAALDLDLIGADDFSR